MYGMRAPSVHTDMHFCNGRDCLWLFSSAKRRRARLLAFLSFASAIAFSTGGWRWHAIQHLHSVIPSNAAPASATMAFVLAALLAGATGRILNLVPPALLHLDVSASAVWAVYLAPAVPPTAPFHSPQNR